MSLFHYKYSSLITPNIAVPIMLVTNFLAVIIVNCLFLPIFGHPNTGQDCDNGQRQCVGDISTQKCNEYEKLIPENCKEITEDLLNNHQTVAQEQEFAHMAIIGFERPNGDINWSCAGSLISEQYILTAGHCLNHISLGPPKYVKIGTIDVKNSGQTLKIIEQIKHPEYAAMKFYNDIGLLKLEKPVKFDCTIRPACLNTAKNIVKSPVIASIWRDYGEAGANETKEELILRKVIVDLVTQEECNSTYKSVIGRRLPTGIQYETQLCAQYKTLKNPSELCRPDGGGPLQIYRTKHLYDIVGQASFGQRCLDAPIVYTRISAYVKWIEGVVWA